MIEKATDHRLQGDERSASPILERTVKEDEQDEIPIPGTVLSPGDHLIELEFRRPVAQEMLLQGLAAMGFDPDKILVDQSMEDASNIPVDPSKPEVLAFRDQWREWGAPDTSYDPTSSEHPVRYRFVGCLMRPIAIVNLPDVRWIYVYRIGIDPFAETAKTDRQLEPYALENGRKYELYFFAWMKMLPSRQAVCDSLVMMKGWRPLKVCALKKNCRLPGRPNASMTLWYAVATWEGPKSLILRDDPLIFENVKEAP